MPSYASKEKLTYLHRKETLKDQLEKKYQIIFGTRYARIVNEEVEKFITKDTINTQDFEPLENAIRERIGSRSRTAGQTALSMSQSLKSNIQTGENISNMQTQTELHTIQPKVDLNIDKSKTQKSQKPHDSIINTELYNPFIDLGKPYYPTVSKPKHDEWAKIQQYKNIQYEKEEEQRRQEEIRKKLQLNILYQAQFKERKEMDEKRRKEQDEWVEQERKGHNDWIIEEEEKKAQIHKMFLQEKEDRLNQVNEIIKRRESDNAKEKLIANKMAEHLKKQYEDEIEYEKQKKLSERERIQSILSQNDLYESKKKELISKEKEEDTKLIKEGIEIEIKKEKQKEEEFRKRMDKIDQRGKFVLGSTQVQESLKKKQYEEERLKRQAIELNQLEEEKERKEQEEKKRRAKYGADLLKEQIIEKKVRNKLLQQEEDKFAADFKKNINEELKRESELSKKMKEKNYREAKDLITQMESEKETVDTMTKREYLMNKQLLDRADRGDIELKKGWRL